MASPDPVSSGSVSRVDSIVSAVAGRFPDKLAVQDASGAITYGELHREAGRLAGCLRELGVGPEELVAVSLPRSRELAVAVLAVLQAGGAYVPLDPEYPRDRLRFVLADSRPRVLLCSPDSCVEAPPETALLHVRLGEHNRLPGLSPVASLDAQRADGSAAAYVVYTSGSSGEPKGVVVEHHSLARLVGWHRRAFAVTSDDRVSQFASPGFDASVWEMWPHWCAGASLHVTPEECRTDPVAFRDWVAAERITISFVPTPFAESLLPLTWPSDTSLRVLLTGGDALQRKPPAELPFRLVNNYGLSETTVVATSTAGMDLAASDEPPSIGTGIDSAELHVVDEQLAPVQGDEPGELLIGGPCLARGYLRRDELTRRRFLPDHLGGRPGRRLYRTGDLVRRNPDGSYAFLGRLDDQVQIRGVRVELGEVESVLCRHPGIDAAAVVTVGTGSSERRLHAFAVAQRGQQPPLALLRTHLAAFLPAAMIPTSVSWLDELPTTAHGKVDRAALAGMVRQAASEPPDSERAPVEATIAAMVADVLGLPSVERHENFFLLGGHSLLGAQLVAHLGERFGVELRLRTLFEHPTVAELAAEVERLLLDEIAALSDEEAERLLAESADEAS